MWQLSSHLLSLKQQQVGLDMAHMAFTKKHSWLQSLSCCFRIINEMKLPPWLYLVNEMVEWQLAFYLFVRPESIIWHKAYTYLQFWITEQSFKAIRRSPSPDNSKGITIAAAKYSSEDAATLVQVCHVSESNQAVWKQLYVMCQRVIRLSGNSFMSCVRE